MRSVIINDQLTRTEPSSLSSMFYKFQELALLPLLKEKLCMVGNRNANANN